MDKEYIGSGYPSVSVQVSINTGEVCGSLFKSTRIDRIQAKEQTGGGWVHKQM
jgi:hypothetical protein